MKTLLLLVTLVSAFALLFIIMPLILRSRSGLAAAHGPWRARLLAYFACLGAGFMLLEIPLVQRLNLFLGHPIYAFGVVLATFLIAGGLGATCVRGVVPARAPAALTLIVPSLLLVLIAMTIVLHHLLDVALGWPTPLRIALAVVLLVPVGILLGMPLPLGIALARLHAPPLIPWLWGVNGALSVTGSVIALALGLIVGFQTALFLGALLYLFSLLAVWRR